MTQVDATFPTDVLQQLRHAQVTAGRLPFPLADCSQRLQREIDSGNPIAAAWILKDAIEAGIKFTASLAIADLLHSEPPDEVIEPLLIILFKGSGVSLGNWSKLMQQALGKIPENSSLLPTLRLAFIKGRRITPLMGRLGCSENNVVAWRNRVFGHGIFQNNPAFYTREVVEWMPLQQELYSVLSQALEGWDLIDSRGISWRGVGDPPPWDGYEHQAEVAGDELFLVRTSDQVHLPLGPLLSIQECEICRFPHTHFFNHSLFKKNRHRTHFLDYFRGHSTTRFDLPAVVALAAKLPQNHKWTRNSFDQAAVAAQDRTIFRSFTEEYRPPEYLYQEVEKLLDSKRGYLQLIGPEGYGKTWLVRGLTEQLRDEGVKVLPYYIRTGERSDYRTFVTLMADEAKINFQERTQEIQTKVDSRKELANQFVGFLDRLSMAGGGSQILIIIDGLDELPEPLQDQASVIDFLPPAEKLPEFCQILLTRREQVRPYIEQAVSRLQRPDLFRTVTLRPEQDENYTLVRSYIAAHLPAQWVDSAMESSHGVFLYAFHLVHAIRQGAFAEGESLPKGREFYPVFLDKIRDRVGRELYDDSYLTPLLLLAAGRQPVSLTQLFAWGVREERLRHALLDLRDFLREHRETRWLESLAGDDQEYRYQIAHDSFIRYLHRDLELSSRLQDTHRHILELTLARCRGRWQEMDMTDDADLYAMRFSLEHARLGNVEPAVLDQLYHVDYAKACIDWAEYPELSERPGLAMELCAAAMHVLEDKRFEGNPQALLLHARVLQFQSKKLNAYYFDHPKSLLQAEYGLTILKKYEKSICSQQQLPELYSLRGKLLACKGFALLRQGLLAEAKEAFDEALVTLDSTTDSTVTDSIRANTLNGIAIVSLFHYDREATVRCYSQAIKLHHKADAAGDPTAKKALIVVLANKSETLRTMNRLSEAEDVNAEIIKLGKLMCQNGAGSSALATGLYNKAVLRFLQGRLFAALECTQKGITLRLPDVQQKKPNASGRYYTNLLAESLYLRELGRFSESAATAKKVVTWRKEQHKTLRKMPNSIAIALRMLASAQVAINQGEQALSSITEAVEFLQKSVDRGKVQTIEGLSAAVSMQGMILAALDRKREAKTTLDKGLAALGERYRLGARGQGLIHARALLCRAALQEEENHKQSLADVLLSREVAAERWRGGSFFMAPEYIRANLLYASLLLKNSDWSGIAAAVQDHLQCLETVSNNLPAGDPEPLERCTEPAEQFYDFLSGLSTEQQDILRRELGANQTEYMDRLRVCTVDTYGALHQRNENHE